ncbi:MAG: ATP-dependent sacrificial sulfur transferase LarE [bacterium]
MTTDYSKIDKLKNILSEMGGVLIAYSGGVDSTLLVKIACDVLLDRVLAVTARSPLYPTSEIESAKAMAKKLGVKHLIIDSDELEIPDFADNPRNRCYLCKKKLFNQLCQIAKQYGLPYILDGSNVDDISDFRPGREAIKESGVRSLLEEVRLTKNEIREISKMMGLPTFDKPSMACLASRFPYGMRITPHALKIVESAEEFIKGFGISVVRIRHYGNYCRIEVLEEEIPLLLKRQKEIVANLKKLGYTYISIDLEGYRTGSMNEA